MSQFPSQKEVERCGTKMVQSVASSESNRLRSVFPRWLSLYSMLSAPKSDANQCI